MQRSTRMGGRQTLMQGTAMALRLYIGWSLDPVLPKIFKSLFSSSIMAST